MHEGQPEDGEHPVDEGHEDQVPVISVPLLQFVLGTVHHRRADVLIHEEKNGQRESEQSCTQYGPGSEFVELHRTEVEGICFVIERFERNVTEHTAADGTEYNNGHG